MDSREFRRQRVFDPIQRVLHWWIALTVMMLVIFGWVSKLIEVGELRRSLTVVHMSLGFILTVGLILRFFWGLIGPRYARLEMLWRSMSSALKNPANAHAKPEAFGHTATGSFAYLIFYGIIAGAALTGLLLAAMRYDQGPFASLLFDDLSWHQFSLVVHNFTLYGATLFIFAHVVGMVRHEQKSGLPVAQSMISGYQYRRVDKSEVSYEKTSVVVNRPFIFSNKSGVGGEPRRDSSGL